MWCLHGTSSSYCILYQLGNLINWREQKVNKNLRWIKIKINHIRIGKREKIKRIRKSEIKIIKDRLKIIKLRIS